MTSVETAPPSAAWATEPFVVGTPEQFRRLRDWLKSIEFTDEAICRKAGITNVALLPSLRVRKSPFEKPVDALSLLVQLFLDSERISWTVVRSILSEDELSILGDLGLLQSSVTNQDLCITTVALIPSEDLYIASDRLTNIETIGSVPADLVYSTVTAETRQFVALMPRIPCESYLEMCAGTGIAALHAAKGFAKQAYSADITERSTRFAQFNAALNGLDNFTAVQGDLYDPVAGQTFDLITAHPPYVPSEQTEMVFRDGGSDGEQITRRIIAGLGEHLRPGGLFYLDCVMTDRGADPIEQRIRRMLGPMEEEFDVLVVRGGLADAKHFQAERLQSGRLSPEAFMRQSELFKRLGVERLIGVTTLIQRRATPRPVITKQRTLSAGTRPEDLLWLLRYLSETVEWGAEQSARVLDCKPVALTHAELRVRSVLRDGVWAAVDAKIETVAPFSTASPCPQWFPTLLSRCDGRITLREHLERLRADGAVPESATPDDFVEVMLELAAVPFFEIELFPIPPSPQGKASNVA
ncbi:MAG TPA: class I SAM-dependent methyltransferase [Gemmatimonadaceae bacterium]